MMKNIFNFLGILILLTTSMLSCKQDAAQLTHVKNQIPNLLDRSDKIQLGKEWDIVQNTYSDKKSAIQEDESDYTSKLELAQLFIKEARVTGEHGHYYPAALEVVNSILKEEGISKDIKFLSLLTKSGVQLSLHEFNDALQTGTEALKLNGRNAQVYGVLVDANVELGNYATAIKLADKMVSLKPDIRSYSRVSYLREIHGDIVGAKAALKLAVEAGYPGTEETAWAMMTLGELYSRYGDNDSAEKIFNQILEMRDNYPFAIAALAEIMYSKGLVVKGEERINEAIDIIPEVGYYTFLARIYKDGGRESAFEEIMKEIFVMLEEDVASGHNMNMEYASIYLNLLEDPKSAISYLEKEHIKRPDNIDVNRMMAKNYLALKELESAKSYAFTASQTNSVHPELLQIKGLLN